MKLNWAERLAVNNPMRLIQQRIEIGLQKKIMPLSKEAVVLEVGCGRGAGAGLILKEFRPRALHALDLDIKMIEMAKTFLSPWDRERLYLYTGSVLTLPFHDATFDAVFGYGVLHHVLDWRGALAEIARVLKDGGLYFIEELYPSLYQNFITKRLLLHPSEDRFLSHDLRETMKQVTLPILEAKECKRLGILGVAVKKAAAPISQ